MTGEKTMERSNSGNVRMGTGREGKPWSGTATIVVSLSMARAVSRATLCTADVLGNGNPEVMVNPAHGRVVSTTLNRLRGRKTG